MSESNNMLAGVDLGSNSFHMIVARQADDGSIQIVDRIKEMVRLGAGLDNNNHLSCEAQQRALDCLQRFAQRLQELHADNIRIVGTNTLRKAKNSRLFLDEAQKILGQPIDIISGIEEARLIYLGVSHTIAAENNNRRLIIDIGGGSTEVIIGKNFTPMLMESLFMGCVSITQKFFPDGEITEKKLKKAEMFASRELEKISYSYPKMGWENVIGTSGSIRSIAKVIQMEGLEETYITARSMKLLRKCIISAGHTEQLELTGLSEERRPVFVGGFVVLNAIINTLKIKNIEISDGALREGLLYDLLGRIRHEDVRENTINRMIERYSIDMEHANNVAATALTIYQQLADNWNISLSKYKDVLRWSALLHEIGLAIAHAGYHKHGAYIVRNSDMPGYSVQDQLLLAIMIQSHRQRFDAQLFQNLPEKSVEPVTKLAIILRLAVILHRNRSNNPLPDISFTASSNTLILNFPKSWLSKNTLTLADLEYEKELLANAGFTLKYK